MEEAKSARFFASAKKADVLQSVPLYLLRTAKSISGRQLARSAGIQKGRKPLCPWGSSGDHGSVPRRLFRHLWRYKWRISRGCIAWSVKRREKESFAYNTEPISKGWHHLIRQGSLDTFPSMGKATALAFSRAQKSNSSLICLPYIPLAPQYQ